MQLDSSGRPKIDVLPFRKFTRLSSWRSLTLIVAIYGCIFALGWIGGGLSHYWLALPALAIIGALQHHLLILLHEGAHGMLHPNKRLNALIADVFCGIPFFVLGRVYAALHLGHHAHTGDPERDPEFQFYRNQGFDFHPRSRLSSAILLAKDFFGVHFLRFGLDLNLFALNQIKKGKISPLGLRDMFLFFLVWAPLLVAFWSLGHLRDLVLFWLVPMATFMHLYLKLHGYGEHNGKTGPTEFDRTWTHDYPAVVDFFLYPIRSGAHLEHHLFPAVPWYRMREFQRFLRKDPEYREAARKLTVDGYFFGKRPIFFETVVERAPKSPLAP